MKKLLLAIALVLPLTMMAQDVKIGYINRQEVISLMPEADAAMKQLEDMQLKYSQQGKALQEELQRKYQEYQEYSTSEGADENILKYKEQEIMRLQQSMQEFSQNAQQTLEKKNQELMAPILDKLQDALKRVGDANDFLYIIDNTADILPYISSKAINVLPLLKKELNLK
ncbi:MAG: OmpH family outer membrane protein [Paludibacteraceae bacterium]|nr:OmpH family outer membrane protein [Paludibacteraceae bacterium]